MDELKRAEVLNEALDALRAGARLEDVSAGLPEEILAMLHAGSRLEDAAKNADVVSPSATFTLSLEEQLRTDLRLRSTEVAAGAWAGRRAALLATTLLIAAGTLALLSADAGLLRPSPADGAPLTVDDALRRLDDGWSDIDSLRDRLNGDSLAESELRTRLESINAAFTDALEATVNADDARAEARVRADVATAAAALGALSQARTKPVGDEIIAAQRLLVVRLLRSRVESLDPAPIDVPGIIISTPRPSPVAGTVPTSVSASPTATVWAPPSPTDAPVVPPASTVVPPLSTEVPSPTSTPMPLDPKPPATTRPRPTDTPPAPTSPPAPIEPPTRTPDAWPTHDPTKAPAPPIITPSPGVDPSMPPPAPTAAPPDPGGVGRRAGKT